MYRVDLASVCKHAESTTYMLHSHFPIRVVSSCMVFNHQSSAIYLVRPCLVRPCNYQFDKPVWYTSASVSVRA